MEFDPREVDLQYKPFPDLKGWDKLMVDQKRVERYSKELEELKEISRESLKKAQNVVKRVAAIETGSIEGLYETDRGFTFTVALQAASWEALFSSREESVTNLINDQIQAYDFILDFATQQSPISVAWIRQLHGVICSSQEKYKVLTPLGWQNHILPKGEYKVLPNHVVNRNDEVHAYCPVEMVPSEMQRFCKTIGSEEFLKLHPMIQAAYAHYILVYIHPFADGNGRVARALASVFTYRKYTVPILIFADERNNYFKSLNESDSENYQTFVNFVSEKAIDAILILKDSIRNIDKEEIESLLEKVDNLYITSGGYSQEDIDKFGISFVREIVNEWKKKVEAFDNNKHISFQLSYMRPPSSYAKKGYRELMNKGNSGFRVLINTVEPASAQAAKLFKLIVPKDCGENDDIVLIDTKTHEHVLEVRPKELEDGISSQALLRIRLFIDREFPEMLNEVLEIAKRKVTN